MAFAISRMVMSWRTSARLGTSTTVSGAAMPRIVVRVTPAANRRVTNSSAKRPSWSVPTGPVITTSVTRSRQAPRRTSGSSASSGRFEIVSTAACTSSAARPMSQPGSNSSSTSARPSRDTEVVLSTPSTAISTGSRSCTMALSTSSAPAPSQATLTETLLTITSGKNCARIRGKAAMPAAISTTSSRLAAVPWRTK